MRTFDLPADRENLRADIEYLRPDMKKLAADIERQCGDIEILSFAVENLSADNWQPGAAVENLAGRREFLPVAARHAGVRRGFFGDDVEARSADMAARDEHMESASE